MSKLSTKTTKDRHLLKGGLEIPVKLMAEIDNSKKMKPSGTGSSSLLQTTIRSRMSLANFKTILRNCYRN